MPPGLIPVIVVVNDRNVRAEGGAAAAPAAVESTAVLGDDGVVADKEERAGEDADYGDDKRGEGGAAGGVIVIDEGERGRGREDDVAPLRAVDAAEALGAVLGRLIGHPCLLLLVAIRGGHQREGRKRGDLRWQSHSISNISSRGSNLYEFLCQMIIGKSESRGLIKA